MPDENVYYEVMTMDEIRMAWKKSQMWGKDQDKERKGSTHDEYRQEMAKKTVINRACKRFLNSSDDGSLLMQYINRADEVAAEAEVEAEIEENANQELIDIEYEVAEDEEENNTEAEEQVEEEKPAEKPKQEKKTQQGKQQTMEGPGF
jgi:recombination protein RecT